MREPGPQPGRSNYLDFELEIGLGTGREYPVTLLHSPAGDAHATMHFPFDELALDLRLGKLQIALLRSGGKHRRAPSEEEQAVQDLGRSLFEALFCGRVRTCYDVSLRGAAEQEMGLRLKLRIRPPELSALPWELLYDPDQAEYVCLSRQTPIVRYLESPRLIRPLTVSPPLRILGMVASPENLPELDIEREVQRVERATQTLRDRGLLELEWLAGQTWRDLQEAMWGGPWHVFHFIGHGGFDVQADEGFIALADSGGRRSDLSATRLSRLLADHAHLRLVLLNACEGGRGSEWDIYSSTASILVHRGIPAVLAMQYAITDRAAIEFARAFYRALAYGMAVDEAVVAARKAIDLAVTNTVEWGTPVLYMRTPDGVLFHLTGAPRAEAGAPAAEADTELERRLEQRYTAGLSAFWLERWNEACVHFQAIVDERPDYQDAEDKLADAQRQKKWGELYEQAQAAREAEDWEAARSALGELVAEKPDYRDAAALLEAINRQVRLAGLYAQAQHLGQAGQWQAVVNVFAQIEAFDPDYPDPEGLLPTAKQELAEQAHRAELDELYRRAVREMDAGRWQEAQGLLRQVQEQEPGYLEAERLLARAESEMKRERQQQKVQAAARKELAARDRPAFWRRLPRGAWVAIGAVAVLVTVSVPLGIQLVRSAALARAVEEALAAEIGAMRQLEWNGDWAMEELDDGTLQIEVTARSPRDVTYYEVLDLQERLAGRLNRSVALRLSVIPTTQLEPLVPPTATPTPTPTGAAWLTGSPAVTPIAASTLMLTPIGGPPLPGPAPTNPVTGTVWEWSDGSAMVYVPAGAFWMGSTDEDIDAILVECIDCQRDWYASEQPRHEVTLDAFWIDRTEVTNAQYRRCVEDGACSLPSNSSSSARDSYYGTSEFDDYPVIYVDWAQANAYCAWAGKRLPTEAEWEKAARGTDKRIYPWGNAFNGSLVNFCDVNCTFESKAENWDDSYLDTSPVGNYPGNAGPYSALDMAGNVWEWVADWYSGDYYASSPVRNPHGPDSGQWRVKRGGSWGDDLTGVRSAIRHSYDPSDSDNSIGFRCARSDSEPPEPVGTATPTDTPPPTRTPTATSRPPTNTPPPTSIPQAIVTLVWEKDDSVMVYVPAGPFWMGSEESDPEAYDDEKPQHEVTLDAFLIDRTEVTNAMFARFVADSGYETEAEKRGSSQAFNASSREWEDRDGTDWQHPYGPFTSLDGLDKHPVMHVTWNDATAYCQWAGKRLPTEAEWEKAARGTDKRIYPWGNAFDGSLVSFCDVNCELDWRNKDWDDGYADTAPVGNYPGGGSPYGAWDMAGNVWEWTSSLYKPYPYDREDGREDQEAGGARVLRGGSWLNLGVRAGPRNVDEPSYSSSNGGFRCASSGSEP